MGKKKNSKISPPKFFANAKIQTFLYGDLGFKITKNIKKGQEILIEYDYINLNEFMIDINRIYHKYSKFKFQVVDTYYNSAFETILKIKKIDKKKKLDEINQSNNTSYSDDDSIYDSDDDMLISKITKDSIK